MKYKKEKKLSVCCRCRCHYSILLFFLITFISLIHTHIHKLFICLHLSLCVSVVYLKFGNEVKCNFIQINTFFAVIDFLGNILKLQFTIRQKHAFIHEKPEHPTKPKMCARARRIFHKYLTWNRLSKKKHNELQQKLKFKKKHVRISRKEIRIQSSANRLHTHTHTHQERERIQFEKCVASK